MSLSVHSNDAIHQHMAEITSKVVAQSGIPSDRFHLGKIILQSLKDNPDMILQIDASTGVSETNAKALKRIVKCAVSLKAMGLKEGDIMILMAPNHNDLCISFYAALCLGIGIAPLDTKLRIGEMKTIFNIAQPKIVFCQSEKVPDLLTALQMSSCDAKIVTFDRSDQTYFQDLLLSCDDESILDFRPTNFDTEETVALVMSTSGTTGTPKLAASTHKNFAMSGLYVWSRHTKFPPFAAALVMAPLQWLSAITIYIYGPFLQFTRLQSSETLTKEHIFYIINTYKPGFALISPTLMTTLIHPGDRGNCDFTCFQTIMVAGSAVHEDLLQEIKKIAPKVDAVNTYGMTEMAGIAFVHGYSSPPASCGKPAGCLQHKLVDINTGKEIVDPHVNGELWVKGPIIFKGYYNKTDETQEVLEDGWFKTGDILYRDEAWNFYFVEKIKLLLKYKSHQISPLELESVIMQHPGVLDVVVTSIPDRECGDLPVACVVPSPDHPPTAQDIKDLVKESLSDINQLRGGVIFMDQFPLTASTKVHRMKIREMVLTMPKE